MSNFGNVLRGVAIGDAYGDPNEFRSIKAITQDNPMGPPLPDKLHVTDDSQMTLFLATALEAARGQDMAMIKEIIQQSFLNYYNDRLANDGTRAPGSTVMGSLSQLDRGKKWQDATNPGSDGSGTVMRTSPCAFLPDDQWVGVTAFAAAVTHGHPNAIAAAILNVALLRDLLNRRIRPGNLLERALYLAQRTVDGNTKLMDVGGWLDGYEVPGGLVKGFEFLTDILITASAHLDRLRDNPWALTSDPSKAPIVANGGWRAPFTLTIALLSIDMIPNDPWLALRRAVTTEGDSDTIGSVCGALIGAIGFEFPDVINRLEPEYQSWIKEASDYAYATGALLGQGQPINI